MKMFEDINPIAFRSLACSMINKRTTDKYWCSSFKLKIIEEKETKSLALTSTQMKL